MTAAQAEQESEAPPVAEPEPEKSEPVAEPEPAKIQKAKPITMGRMKLEVEARNPWLFTVPTEVTPEQCMDEGFWQHVSMRLRAGDQMIVVPDNGAWELVLGVIGAGRNYAHVVKKVLYDLKPLEQQIKIPSIYKVDYHGLHHKWRVLREGQMLRDGFETEQQARQHAANHEAAVLR